MKVIQWLLDNLFAVLIIAGVLSQLFQAIRGRKGADPEAPAEAPKEYEFEDPELSERTRKIREDIRRRIAERQRQGAGPESPPAPVDEAPAYEEPPLVREVVLEAPRPVVAEAMSHRYDAQRAAEILEQQASLAERLRQAEEMKAAAARRAAFEEKTASTHARQRQQRRGALLEDLRSPDALRRAVILREVLGPPVGLR